MEERPKSMRCGACNREVNSEKDIQWIPTPGLGQNTGFWYGLCRYCRATETRRKNKYKSSQ